MTESNTTELADVAAAEPAPLSIKDTVLAQFRAAEVTITTLANKYRDVAYDVSTPKGMKDAIAARADLRDNGRLFVTKAETRIKGEVNDLKRVMATETERLVGIIKPVEDHVDGQIKAEETRKAAEKAERERIAAEKAEAHRAKIAKIRAAADNAKGISSERITNGIAMVEGLTFGPECEDFLPQYEVAKAETLASMRQSLADAQAREAAEAQRLENERIAAKLEAQRKELEDQAAELKRLAELQEATRAVAAIVFPEVQYIDGCMYSTTTFKENGKPIMLDPYGKRSVFCDLNDDTEAQPTQQVLKAEPVMAEATDRGEAVIASPSVGSMGAGQAADAAPAGDVPASFVATNNAARAAIAEAAPVAEPATLKLGVICERLGFTLTAAFVADTLGIQHSATDKAAKLYKESDFGLICDALVIHVQAAKTMAHA